VSPVEILRLLKQQPFQGVRLCISDGREYEVRHPDMVLVTTRLIHIALPPIQHGVPSGETVYVDPLHITRVEPLTVRRRVGNGKSRSA
jgi:hypothetical protein